MERVERRLMNYKSLFLSLPTELFLLVFWKLGAIDMKF